MPRYIVGLISTASYVTTIEADSKEDAVDIAYDNGVPHLCHQEEVELNDDWDVDFVEEDTNE